MSEAQPLRLREQFPRPCAGFGDRTGLAFRPQDFANLAIDADRILGGRVDKG